MLILSCNPTYLAIALPVIDDHNQCDHNHCSVRDYRKDYKYSGDVCSQGFTIVLKMMTNKGGGPTYSYIFISLPSKDWK